MRRRQPAGPVGIAGVPDALFDFRDAAWVSDQAARAWCVEHGVPGKAVRDTLVSGHERQRRRRAALNGWAKANDYMSTRYPEMPDLHALKALGLVAAGSPTGPCSD